MTINTTNERPWGFYRSLEIAEGFQVKYIEVKPAGRLSLQKHFKRSEHWVVVRGEVNVTVDGTTKTYKVGEHLYIPVEAVHRLENTTSQAAAIVEVQIGSYLGEDDIVRLEDDYGRTN